jgi:hypothetical protein
MSSRTVFEAGLAAASVGRLVKKLAGLILARVETAGTRQLGDSDSPSLGRIRNTTAILRRKVLVADLGDGVVPTALPYCRRGSSRKR